MLALRLSRHLVTQWRGTRWVRGTVYTAASHADYLEMLGSGLFVPAGPIVARTPAERKAALGRRLEIVAVRNAGLGDTLMALPYVQEFARTNPRADVSFAVHPLYVDMIAAQPGLHAVYDFCAGRDFPREIDLCNYPERHRDSRRVPRGRLFGTAFGINRDLPIPRLRVDAAWTARPRAVLEAAGWSEGTPLVALTCYGTCDRRSYRPELLREVAAHLVAAGAFVVLTDLDPPQATVTEFPDIGDRRSQVVSHDPASECATGNIHPESRADISFPNDMSWRSENAKGASAKPSHSPIVSLKDRTTVAELAGLLSLADVVVAPDTGVLHLAGHLGKPMVGIFTDWPARLRLASYHAIAFEPRELPCHPCHNRGCPPLTCTGTAEPAMVAAAALACLRLPEPAGGAGWRDAVVIFGRPFPGA